MAIKAAIRNKNKRDLLKSYTLLVAIIGSVMLLFEGALWVAGLSLLTLSIATRFVFSLITVTAAVSYDIRKTYYSDGPSISLATEEKEEQRRFGMVTEAPIAQALTLIIREAVKAQASEIHFQPQRDSLRIRARVKGILTDFFTLPLVAGTSLINHLKALAHLSINLHGSQEGQVFIRIGEKFIGCKIATTPTKYGETVVISLSIEATLEDSSDIEKQISDLLSNLE